MLGLPELKVEVAKELVKLLFREVRHVRENAAGSEPHKICQLACAQLLDYPSFGNADFLGDRDISMLCLQV